MRSIASKLAAAAALLASTAVTVSAQTPTAWALDLVYDVRVGGVRAFSANGRVLVDNNTYAAEASFQKEGIVAALSQTFNGRNRVTGLMAPAAVTPRTGHSLIETRSTRTWQVTYRGDGSFNELHAPQMPDRPERRVTPQQKAGAVDPLSAAALGMLQGTEPCGRTYRIFDSRRRFDVEMRRVGTARIVPADGPLLQGEAVVCIALINKIAGYAADDYDTEKANRNPPKLYLANIAGTRGWYPYKLEMNTSFGNLVGRLSSVKVTPLSDADRAAMRR